MFNWYVNLIRRFKEFKLLDYKNVTGVCTGYKNGNGDYCIKVFVEKKPFRFELNKEDIIPKKIFGVKTDVEVMEMPKAYVTPDRKKYDELKGGIEIAPTNSNFVGTLGNIYIEESINGKREPYVLKNLSGSVLEKIKKKIQINFFAGTNLHVVAKDVFENPIGTSITQPGISTRIIGYVSEYFPMSKKGWNEFDEAVVVLDTPFKIDHIDSIKKIGQPRVAIRPFRNMEVKKYGRTTRYTEGYITNTSISIRIDYGKENGILKFRDVMQITPQPGFKQFSDGGDSGSLITTLDNRPVGRLFAGNSIYTFAIPMVKIIKKLRMRPY